MKYKGKINPSTTSWFYSEFMKGAWWEKGEGGEYPLMTEEYFNQTDHAACFTFTTETKPQVKINVALNDCSHT